MNCHLLRIGLLSLALLIGACQKKNKAPDNALLDFIDYRLGMGQSKDKLLSMTTGPLHEEISKMDESAFREYVRLDAQKKKRVTVNFRKCDPHTCQITYTISYITQSEGQETFSVEAKKIAELRLVDEDWKLAEVTDIKSYYEGREIKGDQTAK